MQGFSLLKLTIVMLTVGGCATPDLVCGMRADYAKETPVAPRGHVRLTWRYIPKGEWSGCAPNSYGCAPSYIGPDGEEVYTLRLKEAPEFGDVCKLARFGHEVAHALGARHE
jgi:hypothetical protein